VHGYSIRHLVEGGQQADDLILAALTKDMKTPCTVFAAAPGLEDALHD